LTLETIQQHYIAENYPGLFDAITPGVSFPDVASIASIDVTIEPTAHGGLVWREAYIGN